MARTYYKVRKGMVFWYEPTPTQDKTCVQQGRRPWLVISNDLGNISSPTCNIVPMTTEDKISIPTHVKTYVYGTENVILCEQAITVDQNCLRNYYCSMTEETMEKVDAALAIQFGIKPTVQYADFNMSNLVEKLEGMFEDIIREKVKQQSQAVTYSDLQNSALKLGQMIEDLVGCASTPPESKPEEGVKKQEITQNCEPKAKPVETEPVKESVETEPVKEKTDSNITPIGGRPSKSKRIKWTVESRCQFLRDCDSLSPEAVRHKYGFSTINTVFTTKYNCRNVLKEMGVDYTNGKATSGKAPDGDQ